MLLPLFLSSLSFCLARETTALAGPLIRDSPSLKLEEHLIVGKILSFIKELKECRESNKKLIMEMSKMSEDVFSSTISNQKQDILNKNSMNKLNDISKQDNKLPFANTNMETTKTPLDKKTSKE